MPARTQCANMDILLYEDFAVVYENESRGTYIVPLNTSAGAKSPVAQAIEAVTSGKVDPISLPPGDLLKCRADNLIRG